MQCSTIAVNVTCSALYAETGSRHIDSLIITDGVDLAAQWFIHHFRSISDINQIVLNMAILIDDIRGWYSDNMLKLNDSKTEMMVISSKFRPSVHLDHIKIGESSISPSETVQHLGVIMDSNYTMVSHIYHKVQESFLKIMEIPYYRRYLTDESSKTAVHACVTSRLDYCNSLLYGLPKELSKNCKVSWIQLHDWSPEQGSLTI